MPHSAGGGSHSGGSHSSHSSSSHHSSSHHSSHSSRRAVAHTNYYYSGANKYLYYYDGKPNFYYGPRVMKSYDLRKPSYIILLAGMIWLALSLLFCCCMIDIGGGKLDLNYDTNIVIEDNSGLVKNENELTEYLKEFRDRTGVTVGVVTNTFDSRYDGINCEDESYICYTSKWSDERHWLIYYVGDRTNRSDEWKWNLMCGDDCVSVLSSQQEKKFITEFQKNLLDTDIPFDTCIINALKTLKPSTGKKLVYGHNVSVNGERVDSQPIGIGSYIFWGLFFASGIFMGVIGLKSIIVKLTDEEKAKMNAIELDRNKETVQIKCEYCSGVYIKGTVSACPFCNAQIDWQ